MLLVGDSTALTLGIGLSYDAARYGATIVNKGILGCGVAEVPEVRETGVDAAIASACNPATPVKGQWPALWAGWIRQYHPAVVAILAGRWEVSTVEWKGHWTDILDPAFAAYVKQQLQHAVDVASSGGAPVVLFTAPCYDSGEQSDGAPWPEDQPARVDAYNTLVRQVVGGQPAQGDTGEPLRRGVPRRQVRDPDRRGHRARARRRPLPLLLREQPADG